MRIAVTTPQGHVGHHLTSMLIRAGARPLLLARHPKNIPAGLAAHVDIVEADSRELDQVVAATAGVDAVYWVDPPPESADPLADYARATAAITAAVERNRIGRVVFQSSVGAEKRHGAGEIDGLAATEVALDRLDVDVTHLRCGYFFTNLLYDVESVKAGHLRTVQPIDSPMSWVAPRDIAEVAALTLLSPGWTGRRVQAVHGPEDLSWAQVASILTEELGHEVRVEQIPDERMRAQYLQLGMPPVVADAVLGMSTGLRDGFVPEQGRSVITTTPTQLRGWLRDEFVSAL
ncbi:NAD(P)H-binding protein [Actinomadura sp. BRA 177]|uniref:NAD(P)H-binding protein n=1 Tax=Actinomadura sp. BRA 177 TaxID=2745202 RepID=UPI001595C763|nr:NAD(P)H-binding protein [Actinomadura sp. BRA 177]NVI87177.1 NAD(P)H-binding protein [Actinomadura sp. BRA 177]